VRQLDPGQRPELPGQRVHHPDSLPQCLDAGGNLSAASNYAPGGSNVIVLVWVCYEWKLAGKIPLLRLGNMGNGSRLIQATTTFRTEPYAN
jgi:hypothetical protein